MAKSVILVSALVGGVVGMFELSDRFMVSTEEDGKITTQSITGGLDNGQTGTTGGESGGGSRQPLKHPTRPRAVCWSASWPRGSKSSSRNTTAPVSGWSRSRQRRVWCLTKRRPTVSRAIRWKRRWFWQGPMGRSECGWSGRERARRGNRRHRHGPARLWRAGDADRNFQGEL